jgi:N-terminal acetyltransferase B complex non-catalytic subunit
MDPGKLQPLLTYLEKHGEATTAYNDLRPFAERLELEDRTQLVRILTSNSSFGDSEKFRNGKPQSRGWLCPEFEDVGFVFITIMESTSL